MEDKKPLENATNTIISELTKKGYTFLKEDLLDEAEEYYKRALNIEFDTYAVLGLALINKAKGNYLEALESLTGLLVNEAKNPRLYTEIAECYIELGNKDKAQAILARYLRTGQKNSRISELLDKVKGD
jgi:tetratricopeptide (TPR) repeat protein